MRRRYRTGVGGQPGQRDRRKQGLELDRDLRALGRLGRLYDHVPPPYEDYDGLGFRVPLIVISPYAKQNYVSHVQYETASVLRFVEDTFGLGQLSASDARANDPAADCFDFTQSPRKFVPIKTKKKADFFLTQPKDDRMPDDSSQGYSSSGGRGSGRHGDELSRACMTLTGTKRRGDWVKSKRVAGRRVARASLAASRAKPKVSSMKRRMLPCLVLDVGNVAFFAYGEMTSSGTRNPSPS